MSKETNRLFSERCPKCRGRKKIDRINNDALHLSCPVCGGEWKHIVYNCSDDAWQEIKAPTKENSMDIEKIKKAGQLAALKEAINANLFLVRLETENAAKDGFKKFEFCIKTAEKLMVYVKELYEELEKMEGEYMTQFFNGELVATSIPNIVDEVK